MNHDTSTKWVGGQGRAQTRRPFCRTCGWEGSNANTAAARKQAEKHARDAGTSRYKVEQVIGDGYRYWRVIDTHDGMTVERATTKEQAARVAAEFNGAIDPTPAAVVTTYSETCFCPGDAIESRGGLTDDDRCPICGTQWKEAQR